MCLSIIWDWLGDNAGQIQIIIAIVAFILAVVVYLKVRYQIKLAKDQAVESIEQTKHFANQVEIAGKQFEASNNQISELIENRKLLLDIRNGELKIEYIKLCVKTIELLQEAIVENKASIAFLEEYIGKHKIESTVRENVNGNIKRIQNESDQYLENIQQLLNISVELEPENDVIPNNHIQKEIHVVHLIYLSVVREQNYNNHYIMIFKKKVPM